MNRRNFLKAGIAVGIGLSLPKGVYAKLPPPPRVETPPYLLDRKVTNADRAAAAANARANGILPGAANQGLLAHTGTDPYYFGPYANYANSPMPTAPIASISVVDGGTGYTAPLVMITDIYGTSSNAAASVLPADIDVVTGAILAITLDAPGSGYTAPVVTITDPTGTGTGAVATAARDTTALSGGIRKFVDSLAGLTPAGANAPLGSYIPLAAADTISYPFVAGDPAATPPIPDIPASDYYEIGLVQYRHQFHTDLPPTLLRGYVQLSSPGAPGTVPISNEMPDGTLLDTGYLGVDSPHYLGPAIVSTKDKAVRILFRNLLPTGTGGDLFIPTDETIMGAGMGPIPGENFKQNRATLHNHGALSPWISDGTPHQWTVPAGEVTPYQIGDSTVNVPDMPDPGPGALTFYYTNQQSARLMFYHDHAFGITRLNVYAGEAAPYLITDEFEQALIAGTDFGGVNPGGFQLPQDVLGFGIPLVFQDKTFVDAATIAAQDPNWLSMGAVKGWGSVPGTGVTGDLWVPNVYMPAQNPWDPSGASAFGRWQYGPWFWPPTANIGSGPVANPYNDPANPLDPMEPPQIPQMPNPSMGMEAFNDTTLVNGVAYPYIDVEPRAYRFRMLNAANDRFFNLHFFEANPAVVTPDGRVNTEVKMIDAISYPNYPTWPADSRAGGVPDPATAGPDWVQIGSEGGFLPEPVVIPPQPLAWNMNPTAFNVGNVTDRSLLIGCAERADVIVDFSQHAGKTLILYNDAPAAFPALDPRYDYYTGCPDQMDAGGAPSTLPGYGPNVRTIMQFNVGLSGGAQALTGVKVTNGGADYLFAPEVVFSGGGIGAVQAAATASGALDHITVLTGGAGYDPLVPPTVTIAAAAGDTTGTGAAAKAIISNGRVTGFIITNPGFDYTIAPDVTISGGGATATAALTIMKVTLTLGSEGTYTSLPSVSLVGGGGYGATAVATFTSGTPFDLVGLKAVFAHDTATSKPGLFEASQEPILVPQAAYNSAYGTSIPEAQSVYVQLHDFSLSFFNGPLTGLTLTAGGTGYTVAPTVSITGGGATLDATATAAITGAYINAVALTLNPQGGSGSGYTSVPTVTIAPPVETTGTQATATATITRIVQSVTITNAGRSYTSPPTVRFNGGGGGGAVAVATITAGGAIATITVISGGSYTGTPTISFQGGGGNSARATAVMTGVVSSVLVTNGGSGYGENPAVTFTGGGGSGAAGTATFVPGVVTSLTLIPPGGAGYLSAPTVAFNTGGKPGSGAAATAVGVSIKLEPKAMHDEMGAAYDIEYGRMGGLIGLELPVTTNINQALVLYPYISPPTDLLKNSITPLGTTNDGTQIWKITHNGVDTHPIHFHLVNVQLVNRVAWDGAMLPPHPSEVGWKETVRVNPLEHCIVAMRPVAPTLPFEVPNSIRLIDVTKPAGVELAGGPGGFIDPLGTAAPVINHMVNFGWEYVWHCHILSHEEMDMMHALSFAMPPAAPSNLAGTYYNSGPRRVALSWVDNAVNETSFTVQRAVTSTGPWVDLTTTVPQSPGKGQTVTYDDTTVARNRTYFYRVLATNTVGDTTAYTLPAVGYPTMVINSDPTVPGLSIVTSTTGTPGSPFIFANAFTQGAVGWAGVAGNVAFIAAAAMGPVGGLGMAAPAPVAGGAGLAAVEPTLPAYVYDDSPANEPIYDANFLFNPNGFESGDGPVDIFIGLDQNSLPIFGVQYENEDDDQELRAWVLQGGQKVFVGDAKITSAAHQIEVAWASDVKAKFSLFVDEKLVGTVTGDTSAHKLNLVMLGAVTGLSLNSSGSLYFDVFTSTQIDGTVNNRIFLPWLNK